jgi:hypothetical protein
VRNQGLFPSRDLPQPNLAAPSDISAGSQRPGVHVRFVGNQDHLRVWAGQAVPSGCDDHDRQASCDRLVAIAAGDDHAARRRYFLLLGTTALTSAFRSGCDLCNQTWRSTRPNSEAPTLMSYCDCGRSWPMLTIVGPKSGSTSCRCDSEPYLAAVRANWRMLIAARTWRARSRLDAGWTA